MRLREITEGVGRITKQNQTVDVGPDEVTKQAAKFGNKVDKDGRPPTLSKKVKGKSTNVLFNLGLSEGYKLQLERDKELLVLNITDTKTGKRTEVRGKPGYESGNYDPNDSLHILLDKVGKSANIAELINGEVVTINPKHPDATKAKAATDVAYNENFVKDTATAIKLIKKYHQTGDEQDAFAAIKHGWNFIKNPKMRSIIVNLVKKVSTENGYPDWNETVAYIKKNTGIDVSNVNENFADGKKKVQEAFNNPYPITWEYLNPTGASSGIVKLDDGSALDIHFSEEPAGVYEIEFARDGSNKQMGRSGQGDEFRVFATVQAAMLKWWKQLDKTSARKITFYANKQDGNRARLYKRFLKMWGDKSGWEIEVSAKSGLAAYSLTNPKPDKPKNGKKTFMQRVFGKKETVENFADGKVKGKSRPGRVKKSGASCNGTVTQLRKRAKNASGEKAKMYHWCANMKSGKK